VRVTSPLTSTTYTDVSAEAGKSYHYIVTAVNTGGEAQKSGVAPRELARVLDAAEAQPGLRLAGLMCVPPFSTDPARARPFFDELYGLREAHGGRTRLPELSMGMSLDFDHAIAAGATLIRVGTAIFGLRAPRAE